MYESALRWRAAADKANTASRASRIATTKWPKILPICAQGKPVPASYSARPNGLSERDGVENEMGLSPSASPVRASPSNVPARSPGGGVTFSGAQGAASSSATAARSPPTRSHRFLDVDDDIKDRPGRRCEPRAAGARAGASTDVPAASPRACAGAQPGVVATVQKGAGMAVPGGGMLAAVAPPAPPPTPPPPAAATAHSSAPPASASSTPPPAQSRKARHTRAASVRHGLGDDENELDLFKVLLGKVIRMRERGEYSNELLNEYNDALVVLPDDALEEVRHSRHTAVFHSVLSLHTHTEARPPGLLVYSSVVPQRPRGPHRHVPSVLGARHTRHPCSLARVTRPPAAAGLHDLHAYLHWRALERSPRLDGPRGRLGGGAPVTWRLHSGDTAVTRLDWPQGRLGGGAPGARPLHGGYTAGARLHRDADDEGRGTAGHARGRASQDARERAGEGARETGEGGARRGEAREGGRATHEAPNRRSTRIRGAATSREAGAVPPPASRSCFARAYPPSAPHSARQVPRSTSVPRKAAGEGRG